jgi:predicted DCC family thiol-disulfide oxidoreductase YuxK
MRQALLQRMRFHAQIHTHANEHIRLPLLQLNKERVSAQLSGEYATPRSLPFRSNYNRNRPSLIYDGICNLCTTAARLLYALDHGLCFEYVPSQQLGADLRVRYGLTEDLLQGQMHLIRQDSSIASGPAALAEICKLLSPFGLMCNILRTRQAQRLYNWIARRRYRLFGCRDSCYIVHADPN